MKRREREINPKKNKRCTISCSQLIEQCPACPLAAINLISILFLKLNTLCLLLRRKQTLSQPKSGQMHCYTWIEHEREKDLFKPCLLTKLKLRMVFANIFSHSP